MVVNFLKRFGAGALAVTLIPLIEYVGLFQDPANLTEFGGLAALVGTIVALIYGGLNKLKDKIPGLPLG